MKITGVQLFWLIVLMSMGMTLIMTLTPSINAAKQDIWISVIVAGGIALLVTYLSTQAAMLYPEQNLIQLARSILGKWLGAAVIIIYFVQWYTILPIVLRQFSDVIQITILPMTPRWAVMLIMIALIVYVTYSGGIESIARCSEILGPIVILMVIVSLIASINNMDVSHLLPVYTDSGAANILKGSLAPASYLGHSVEYLMLASFLYKPKPDRGSPYAYAAVIMAAFIVLIAMTVATATIGVNLASKMWYPFFEMSRKISLFGFIENLDPLPIVIWVASVFIKLAVYMFVTSYGTAQFLHLKNWRIMVWLLAPVVLTFAMFPRNISEAAVNYLLNYWVPFVLPVNMIGLPLLLLVVGKIKQGRSQQGRSGQVA